MNKIFLTLCLQLIFCACFIFSDVKNEPHHHRLNIDKAVEKFMQKHDIPGVAVGYFDGHQEHFVNYGVADKATGTKVTEHTIFEIASVTKVFTTTAIALHVLQGNMALNDPISKYISQLNNPLLPINHVTLLNLATHSSSLPRVGGNWRGSHQIYEYLKQWKPDNTVGTHYAYSNLAFGLLGYALESVEKRPYGEIIKEDILIPLGMDRTFTHVPQELFSQYSQGYNLIGKQTKKRPHGYIPGSGALRSTTTDLMKFLKANMGVSGPEKLVKAMHLAQQPYYKVRDDFTMGLAWQRFTLDGHLIIDKNGGLRGFTSYIGWIPEKKVGVVILTNKTKARTTNIGRHLLMQLSKKTNEKVN